MMENHGAPEGPQTSFWFSLVWTNVMKIKALKNGFSQSAS